jgi:hypothetical protein
VSALVKRGRGRPPKDSSDIELVSAVRAAEAAGSTVPRACYEIAGRWTEAERVQRRYDSDREACASQLERRYHRVASECLEWVPSHPRRALLAKIYGWNTLVRRRVSAYKLFKRRPHKN